MGGLLWGEGTEEGVGEEITIEGEGVETTTGVGEGEVEVGVGVVDTGEEEGEVVGRISRTFVNLGLPLIQPSTNSG